MLGTGAASSGTARHPMQSSKTNNQMHTVPLGRIILAQAKPPKHSQTDTTRKGNEEGSDKYIPASSHHVPTRSQSCGMPTTRQGRHVCSY